MTQVPHSAGRGSPRPRSASSDTLLERLKELHPQSIDLSLGRIERLLAALGHPEEKLPPVLHVAGTNGKGSFLAFSRAIAEALGKRVHVYTSPHLVHFHERIVLAGFSQGAAMALFSGTRYPEKLAGLMGLSGYMVLAPKFDAERSNANQTVPIFLAHGTEDPVVPLQLGAATTV